MEDEKDVKDTEDSSTEETEEEKLDKELEIEDADDKEGDSEDTSEESEDGGKGEEKKESEGKTPEELSKEQLLDELDKERTENKNLEEALRQARSKKPPQPSLAQSVQSVPRDEKLVIKPEDYVQSLVRQAEEEAKVELYQEYPELHPDNDPDNTLYNDFAKEFAVAARMKGVTPVTKDHFLSIGRLVMSLKTGKAPTEKKQMAQSEAKKDAARGDAANIGGTSPSSSREKSIKVRSEEH